jgi:hypothetical protein
MKHLVKEPFEIGALCAIPTKIKCLLVCFSGSIELVHPPADNSCPWMVQDWAAARYSSGAFEAFASSVYINNMEILIFFSFKLWRGHRELLSVRGMTTMV